VTTDFNPSSGKPKVLIFRNQLLPTSETFIRAQADALKLYEPHFAGVHAARESLDLPSSSTLLDRSSSFAGKARRRLFWRTSFAPAFHRGIEKVNPALIHAHFALDGAAALPIARRLGIPLIVSLHGYDVTSSDRTFDQTPEGRLYLRRRAQLWHQTSLFLCISRFIYDRALALGFPREKLRVHYTGSDLHLFENSSHSRDPNLIVFVGRLVEKKGLRYLLDALDLLRPDHPDIRLVCVGDGPLREALQTRATTAGLNCTFLGSQPREVVRSYLAEATLFCVPSVEAASGDSEGLGMVFIEAQAMGTPVVSFHHGGIPEVVLHGRTGLLAPERDRDMLAFHLGSLLSDRDRWLQYSERGRQWVRQAFNLQSQTRELETIYSHVVRQSKSSPGL
jgi:colanic acid/amylovoran biosynthesis glycosyltransferase